MMIHYKQLRIGNWVQFDNKYYQIHSVSKEFPTLDTNNFGIGVVSYFNLVPIYINQHVLIKCGFDRSEDMGEGIKRYYSAIFNQLGLWIMHDEETDEYTI